MTYKPTLALLAGITRGYATRQRPSPKKLAATLSLDHVRSPTRAPSLFLYYPYRKTGESLREL